MNNNPQKFYKPLGNVKDEDISQGEIRLLQTIIRECEDDILHFKIKRYKVSEKAKKMWNEIRKDKRRAKESEDFINKHPLFASMCMASGMNPEKGRKLFFKKVEKKFLKKIGSDGNI